MTTSLETNENPDGKQNSKEGELLEYIPTSEEWRMRTVYGDWLHDSNRRHLYG